MTLKELREQQEWSREDLAAIAEVDVQVIRDIEDGKPVDWAIATRITVKVRNHLGNKAIEGLYIPHRES